MLDGLNFLINAFSLVALFLICDAILRLKNDEEPIKKEKQKVKISMREEDEKLMEQIEQYDGNIKGRYK